MLTALSDAIKSRSGPRARALFRSAADLLLTPVGSIRGSIDPVPMVALTFDDGPDPMITPRLLDLLDARGSVATFFVLTDKADAQPQLIRSMINAGHEIGLHFDRHDRMTRLPLGVVRARLREAKRSLEALAGPIRFFRPPFGAQNLSTYLVARRLGLDVVCWGVIAEDWVEQPPSEAANRALCDVCGGDVILLHDGLEVPEGEIAPRFDRVRMVEHLLDGLEQRALKPTTVGGLIEAGGARRAAWFRR